MRDRIIDILLAHRLLRQQRLHPGQILPSLDNTSLRLCDLGLGAGDCRSKGHRIDLIEPLPFFYISAFRIEHRLQNPRDLRSNLNRTGCLRPTDKLRFIGNHLSLNRDDFHLRHRLRRH